MQNKGIDIGTILNKLDDTVDVNTGAVKTFGFRFLKVKDENGKILGEIVNARKGVKNPKAKHSAPKEPKGKFRFNLKSTGNIMLFDEEKQRYRTIKVACIYQFRNHGETKWLDRI